jgi:hypothetical protein
MPRIAFVRGGIISPITFLRSRINRFLAAERPAHQIINIRETVLCRYGSAVDHESMMGPALLVS